MLMYRLLVPDVSTAEFENLWYHPEKLFFSQAQVPIDCQVWRRLRQEDYDFEIINKLKTS